MSELSFNKRISLVKKEVFEKVTSSDELSNISGTSSTGYYSLETIYKFLYPILDKYNLDVDIVVNKDNVTGTWIDCLGDSEKARIMVIDFSELVGLGKLPLMQNVIQSKGAVMSYLRRYFLTTFLGLPATDKIDGASAGTNSKQGTPPRAETVANDNTELKRLKNILYLACNKDNNAMLGALEQLTGFTNKDGKEIKGIRDFAKLSEKRLEFTLKDAIKKYPEAAKAVVELEKKKE